jgi:hypothetical protein
MTFGIQTWAFPITDEGGLRRERHQQWMDARRSIESRREKEESSMSSSSRECILVPSRFDVVLGRGQYFQNHPGNLRVRFLMESLLPRYDELPRREKATVTQQVIVEVKQGGSRFLKQVDGGGVWQEVNDVAARKKVSHDFRTLRGSVSKKRGQNRIK